MNSEHQANLLERIQPVYRTERVNEPIPLLSGRVEVVIGEERATGEGEMYLDWLPHPKLGVWVYPDKEFAGIWYPAWATDRWRVEFSEWDVFMQVAPTVSCWNPRPDTHDVISAVVAEPFTVGMAQELDYAILHLVNFHEYWGLPLQDGVQRMEWLTPAWRITVDQLPEFAELKEQLRGGGYAITHAVKVERADGKPFRPKRLENLLTPLGMFLSFARGSWCAPVLAVGFTNRHGRVWEMWKTPDMHRIPSLPAGASWFPEHRPNEVATLFAEFCKMWQDKE